MNEQPRMQNETSATSDAERQPTCVYRWDYSEQSAYEQKKCKKEKRGSAVAFAFGMAFAFLAVLGLLVAVLLFRDSGVGRRSSGVAENVAGAVAEQVSPATVLVYASGELTGGFGTGFFVRSDGYLVTNYHVVRNASFISVQLYESKKTIEAKLIGFSEDDDIAVLRVSGSGFPTVTIGNSDSIAVGDVAIAIGNPGGTDAAWTTTQGIISLPERKITVQATSKIIEMNVIQTDTAVNPGNSGGPLCNDRGEVIGIVTRKMVDSATESSTVYYEGIGFALPINGSMELVNAIIRTGNADSVNSKVTNVRPRMGIQCSNIQKGESFRIGTASYEAPETGVLVGSVTAHTAVWKSLYAGDIIVSIDNIRTETKEKLVEELSKRKVGERVEFAFYRPGESELQKVTITLGETT